jgi:hypothetical protein
VQWLHRETDRTQEIHAASDELSGEGVGATHVIPEDDSDDRG